MDTNVWLPVAVAVAGFLIALAHYLSNRQPGEAVTLEGFVEDGVEVVTEAIVFAKEMTPVASTLVQGLRQKYINGETDFEELKPEATAAMRKLFPDADEDLIDNAIEAAVFASKLASGWQWHKPEEAVATAPDGTPLQARVFIAHETRLDGGLGIDLPPGTTLNLGKTTSGLSFGDGAPLAGNVAPQ